MKAFSYQILWITPNSQLRLPRKFKPMSRTDWFETGLFLSTFGYFAVRLWLKN